MSGFSQGGETGNWNIAAPYSIEMVFTLFKENLQYKRMCRSGAVDITQEFTLSEGMKKQARIRAMERLAYNIKDLIDNTTFAVLKKDKDKMSNYREQIDKLIRLINKSYIRQHNEKENKAEIVIIEDIYENILKQLTDIDADLRNPIGAAEMIFNGRQDFDIDEWQAQIGKQIVEGG